jgi:hypothetical protein
VYDAVIATVYGRGSAGKTGLCDRSLDSTGQMDVSSHDGDSLTVNRTQVGVLKQVH